MSRRITARIGRRGAALLFFALLDAIYCLGLLTVPRPMPEFYAAMDGYLPLAWWAAAWAAVGVVCLAYAFSSWDSPAFVAAVVIKVAWGLFALLGWLSGSVDRGYVSSVIWLGFAAFVFLIAGGIPQAPPRTAGRFLPWNRS